MKENITENETTYLKDMPLFRNNKNVLNFLKYLNILTLDDLLKCDDIFDLINQSKINKVTKNEARGLIELARYKYLGEPLIVDSALNNVITVNNPKFSNVSFSFGEITPDRFGFSSDERNRILRLLKIKAINGEYYNLNIHQGSIGTIIDILSTFLHMQNVNNFSIGMKEKIKIYREAYYNNKNVANSIEEIEIENLKELIEELTKKIVSYKKDVDSLQMRLNELQTSDEKQGEKHEK